MDIVEVAVTAQMPDEFFEAFIQHLRDFEQQEPDQIHISMKVVIDSMLVKDAIELFNRVKPEFPFIGVKLEEIRSQIEDLLKIKENREKENQ